MQCIKLIEEALKLRKQSSKANNILKKKIKCNTVQKDTHKISLSQDDTAKTDSQDIQLSNKKEFKMKSGTITKKKNETKRIRIEDFESSDDDDSIGDVILEDLDSAGEEIKVSIEDFESSDSFEDLATVMPVVKEDSNNYYGYNQAIKEKQFLDRERRKVESRVIFFFVNI